VATLVETALSEHFYRTSWPRSEDHDPLDEGRSDSTDDIAGPSTLGQPITDVIRSAAGVEEPVANDILRVLSERHSNDDALNSLYDGGFDKSVFYARWSDSDYEDECWFAFEKSIKAETRFFNREAEEILTSMFQALEGQRTTYGRRVVVDAGPGTDLPVLYRARAFQGESSLREAMKRPDRDVGPPPANKAVPGRMNAAGITVFYGATEADVALAEVQPPVGSKVLIGHFQVLRNLRLLDIEALRKVEVADGSVFDPDHIRRLRRAAFLRSLSDRMARPVMPDDRTLDYLPTQAIADFLANALDPPLDGILYPSVQVGFPANSGALLASRRIGRNVVLFHKAARVQPFDILDDATIEVRDDSDSFWLFGDSALVSDDPGLKYTVCQPVASGAHKGEEADATLKLSNLEVRYVQAIKFRTQDSLVSRTVVPEAGGQSA